MNKLSYEIEKLHDYWVTIKDKVVYYYWQKLLDIVLEFWSPLKIYNLQVISDRIKQAQDYFLQSIEELDYKWNYTYCYCTKSNHFSFVINEILKNSLNNINSNSVHLETSSDFDFDIINSLNLSKDIFIVHNWYKPEKYLKSIIDIQHKFHNSICVLDNREELDDLEELINDKIKIWIRMSTYEPIAWMKESRFWIQIHDISSFYEDRISDNDKFELKMLHFFISKWISESENYFESLKNYTEKYCELKKKCSSLDTLNIGWWFPIHFDISKVYNYKNIIWKIVKTIMEVCDKHNVEHPNIFTEFWSYTVWESAINIFKVLWEKNNISRENWYIVDSSFIASIPDTWAINQKFPVIPINNLDFPFKNVLLWWISCDKDDYLSDENDWKFRLPTFDKNNPLYLAVLHTWAYQENLSWYSIWWLSHCQLDWEKILIMNTDWNIEVFFDAEDKNERLKTLGYSTKNS